MTTKLILPKFVSDFMSLFKNSGYQIYIVGGAVRDLLLGRSVENWDFTTDAKPEKILKLFPQGFYNNKYGTVTIPIPNIKYLPAMLRKAKQAGQKSKDTLFEITPFRRESDYKDLRHPEKITWEKTIEEDLGRRDFTINAIAFDGEKLIDPWEGKADLAKKIIKAVGNPNKRFSEDALRLLRAVRLASELGFIIEEKTRQSMIKNAHLITKISKERIRDELFKILSSDYPSEGILFLRNTGLLKYILPELDACFSTAQKSPKRHHVFDVGTHLVMSLKACRSSDVIVRLATLLHDIGKPATFKKDEKTGLITFFNHEIVGGKIIKKIADDLRLSSKQKEKLYKLVRYHQFTVSELQTDKAIRRLIKRVGKEYLQDILDLRLGDRIGSGARPSSWRFELFKKRLVKVQKQPFKITDLKIDGCDVMKILNLKPGPQIGKILRKIFNEVVEKKIKNEREILLKRIQEINL
jgi:putative nucleotidyltransferase with HDIG domain